eukprot:Selendium_serpulae@DN1210_c0_g1_i1.p1
MGIDRSILLKNQNSAPRGTGTAMISSPQTIQQTVQVLTTCWKNSASGTISPQNRHLIAMAAFSSSSFCLMAAIRVISAPENKSLMATAPRSSLSPRPPC